MGERLTPRTLDLDLEVRGSSLVRRVVSLDKELYSTLSLFTQLYKWVQATHCWGGGGGGNSAMDWHSGQGGVAILHGLLHATEIGNKLRPCGPLARVRLYPCTIGNSFRKFSTPSLWRHLLL